MTSIPVRASDSFMRGASATRRAGTRVGGPYRREAVWSHARCMASDTAVVGNGWVEYLDADECRRLLAAHPVGRVAVLVHGAPEIFPVNHAFVDGAVVFRTDDGTKLQALDR